MHQAFTAGVAQIQKDLPLYRPLEDHVRRATSVNWVQHSQWAVEEEHITPTNERPLALGAQQGTSALRILLPMNPTLVPKVITVQMGLSMQHSFHVVKAITMALKKK